jgi:hypothetical protein
MGVRASYIKKTKKKNKKKQKKKAKIRVGG